MIFLSHSSWMDYPGNKSSQAMPSKIQKCAFQMRRSQRRRGFCFLLSLIYLFMSCFGLVIIFCHHKIKWDKRNYNSSSKTHMHTMSGIRRSLRILATICHANVILIWRVKDNHQNERNNHFIWCEILLTHLIKNGDEVNTFSIWSLSNFVDKLRLMSPFVDVVDRL